MFNSNSVSSHDWFNLPSSLHLLYTSVFTFFFYYVSSYSYPFGHTLDSALYKISLFYTSFFYTPQSSLLVFTSSFVIFFNKRILPRIIEKNINETISAFYFVIYLIQESYRINIFPFRNNVPHSKTNGVPFEPLPKRWHVCKHGRLLPVHMP